MHNRSEIPAGNRGEILSTAAVLGWGVIKATSVGALKLADYGVHKIEEIDQSRITDNILNGLSSLLRHDLGGSVTQPEIDLVHTPQTRVTNRRGKTIFAPWINGR